MYALIGLVIGLYFVWKRNRDEGKNRTNGPQNKTGE
jgi:hypothetical protein